VVAARLRTLARRGVELAGGALARAQVARFARATAGRHTVVLDIDNTLADSWPTFLRSWASEAERLAAIEPLPHIKAVAHDGPVDAGAAVLFLSHRDLRRRGTTIAWLQRHGFAAGTDNVVLVARPDDKLAHLRRLADGRRLEVWDDLTARHETGQMVRYDQLTARIGALALTHHGWDDIVAITGRGLDRPV